MWIVWSSLKCFQWSKIKSKLFSHYKSTHLSYFNQIRTEQKCKRGARPYHLYNGLICLGNSVTVQNSGVGYVQTLQTFTIWSGIRATHVDYSFFCCLHTLQDSQIWFFFFSFYKLLFYIYNRVVHSQIFHHQIKRTRVLNLYKHVQTKQKWKCTFENKTVTIILHHLII